MADIFNKKRQRAEVPTDQEPTYKLFLKKTHSSSIAEIAFDIKVKEISEIDIHFTSSVPIATGANIHFRQPVDFFVYVHPIESKGKEQEYFGLIHCLGETDKQELRRFVNSIFFRDHDAMVLADTEGFKKLNEKKAREKEEKERLRLEKEKKILEERAAKANSKGQ
jgi:hypothetical protein